MRTPFRNRPALPTAALPARDHLGRDVLGWCAADAEPAIHPQHWPSDAPPAVLCGLVLRSLELGVRSDALARGLAGFVAGHRGALLDPVAWAVADCGRLAAEIDTDRAGLPWAYAAALATERMHAFSARQDAVADPGIAELSTAIARGAGAAAAHAVQVLIAQGATQREVLGQLADLACRHPGDAGVAAIAVAKVADLGAALGEDGLLGILPHLAADLAQRPERLASTVASGSRLAALRPSLLAAGALRDEAKARAFVEPKFRVHLVDGKPEQALKACLRAAEVGIPHELLAQSLSLAAAERVLRCDPRWSRDTTVAESAVDAAHLLILASAVRQLRGLASPAAWLELLLFSANLVAESATLDRPLRDRTELPEPAQIHQTWDHGPEIAKIVGHLQAGRGPQAVAVLRAYFLLVLPEQPLCTQLREASLADRHGQSVEAARAIALMAAAVDEFSALSAHPHRELLLAAALGFLAEPQPPRSTLAVAEAALQRLQVGWQVQTLVQPS